MNIDEIKAIMSTEPAEGEEDNRIERVIAEIEDRDAQIAEANDKIISLTNKVTEMVDTNAKLVEQIKYVEPDDSDEKDPDEEEIEFADFSKIYEED